MALGNEVNGVRVPELDFVVAGVRMVNLPGPSGQKRARCCCRCRSSRREMVDHHPMWRPTGRQQTTPIQGFFRCIQDNCAGLGPGLRGPRPAKGGAGRCRTSLTRVPWAAPPLPPQTTPARGRATPATPSMAARRTTNWTSPITHGPVQCEQSFHSLRGKEVDCGGNNGGS